MAHFKRKFLVTAISALIISSSNLYATTLTEAVRETVCTNPDIGVNIKRVLADTQKVGQARAGYLPKVDVNAGFGREQAENTNTGFQTVSMWRRELGVTGREMIFDGFATRSEVARNKAITDADAYQVWGSAEDIGLKAAEAYLNVLRTREIVRLAQKNLNVHQDTYGMIYKLSKSGVGREADTDQASGRLALARANLVAAESDARDAATTYQKLVGTDPMDLSPPPVPRPADLPQNLEGALSVAILNHPILKSANADIKQAKAQDDAAKAVFYPRLDAVGNISRNHNVGSPGPDNDATALLQLQYNIFRGGGDVSRKNETAYEVQEAREIRNRTYRQVVENMRLSWSALLTARDRLTYLESHQDESIKALAAYQQQFQLGKRTLLDVLDSQNELFTSQTSYVNGRYDVIDAKYRILNGEGKLLPYLRVNIPPQALFRYDNRGYNSSYPTF
jgi:adhesin transport system outer membrane protein